MIHVYMHISTPRKVERGDETVETLKSPILAAVELLLFYVHAHAHVHTRAHASTHARARTHTHTHTHTQVAMIEYLVIRGLNDTPEHADALATFCLERSRNNRAVSRNDIAAPLSAEARRDENVGDAQDSDTQRCLLNLIPYNPTEVGERQGFLSPSRSDIDR